MKKIRILILFFLFSWVLLTSWWFFNIEAKRNDSKRIKKIHKLYLKLFNYYYHSGIENQYYYAWIKRELEILEKKYKTINNFLEKYEDKIEDEKKKKILELVKKINNLAYDKVKNKYEKNIKEIEERKIRNLISIYYIYKNNNFFMNILKNYKIKNKKELIYKKLQYSWVKICQKQINDFILLERNINFSWIKLIIKNNDYQLWTWFFPYVVKISSIVWLRYLNWRRDYHMWWDLALSNLPNEINYNCKILRNAKLKRKYKNFITLSKFKKEYCNKNNNIKDLIKNYKNIYNIYIKLDKNFWENFDCYIWKNRSIYNQKRYVWFWLFLMCISKDKTYGFIMWHNDINNFYLLSKQWILEKINNEFERFKLSLYTSYFYERNWYWFDSKTIKWKNKYQLFWYWKVNMNNEFYKINFNKIKNSILIKYGNSWFSFWKHIHFGILLINWDIVKLLDSNYIFEKTVKKLFNNNRISLSNNYYFFFSNK